MEKFYIVKVYASRTDEKENKIMELSKVYKTQRGANNWAQKRFSKIYATNEDVTMVIEKVVFGCGIEATALQVSYIHA